MSKSSYAPFSMMGEDRKEKIDAITDQSLMVYEKILNAPEAAKPNLMQTDFKVANSALTFVGRILQAESAQLMAFTVLANRAGKSKDFQQMISDNLPKIHLPEKKKLKA